MNTGTNTPAWNSNASNITNVTFHKSFGYARPTSCYKWFDGMSALTSFTNIIYYLNTSNVTNMSRMFYNCESLTSLDVSKFNTANVTNMSNMFFDCSSLTTLNLSSFNTANVTNMTGMFSGCSSLTTLNVSNFNTANVTSMGAMLWNCSGITSLDLSNFTVASTANTSLMLSNMRGLQTLTLSSSLASYMNGDGCQNIGTDANGNVATPCTLIYPIDTPPTFTEVTPNYVVWNGGYFKNETMAYAILNGTTLTFYYDGNYSLADTNSTVYMLNSGTNEPDWHDSSEIITSVVFDESFAKARPTTCYSWYEGMSSLATITGIKNLNTSNVTNMQNMFKDCTNLSSLDLSGFKVTSSTNTTGMLQSMTSLQTLTVSSSLVSYLDDNACQNIGSSINPCTLIFPLSTLPTITETGVDWVGWKGGIFICETLAYALLEDDALTFYYDCYYLFRLGGSTIYILRDDEPLWYDDRESITSVVFDESFANYRPISCSLWFGEMSSLATITGIENLNTSNVTNMAGMFNGCEALTSLDVSHFDTSNVTDMSYMFSYCEGLNSLDVSHFDTSNVTSMYAMFGGCTNLTRLDVSNFDTSNVTNMVSMFAYCTNLTTIYGGDEWSTAALEASTEMFMSCENLVGGNGTVYDEAHVDAAYAHVDGVGGPGYFTTKPAFLPGDVNNDDDVTIADVTALVDIIMGNDPEGTRYNHAAADIVPGGTINIDDVNALVNMILNP